MSAPKGAAAVLRERMQEAVDDVQGQVLAIRNAVSGPEVSPAARKAAAVRAGGMRDAAALMQEALEETRGTR